MSVFKDFPGLENLEKLFQDFQGHARALNFGFSTLFLRSSSGRTEQTNGRTDGETDVQARPVMRLIRTTTQ